MRSKQLSSVSVSHVQVFAEFSRRVNSIHNIIPLLKEENLHLKIIISVGHERLKLHNCRQTND